MGHSYSNTKVALGGGTKHDHATPFIKELGWLKVYQKYRYEVGVLVYNVLRGNVPNHFLSLPIVRDVSTVNTRQQDQLCSQNQNTVWNTIHSCRWSQVLEQSPS